MRCCLLDSNIITVGWPKQKVSKVQTAINTRSKIKTKLFDGKAARLALADTEKTQTRRVLFDGAFRGDCIQTCSGLGGGTVFSPDDVTRGIPPLHLVRDGDPIGSRT